MGALISVVSSNDASVIANAIFNGPGVSIAHATFERSFAGEITPWGFQTSGGTFSNGPFGIGSGGILTTGAAKAAQDPQNTRSYDTEVAGSTYCGLDTTNGAVLSVDIVVEPQYNGLLVEFVLGTTEDFGEPDPIGIYLDGVQHAIDTSGNRITAISDHLASPIGIEEHELFKSTLYERSSPPLIMGLPASPGTHTVVFAICDANNGGNDSGLMVKARGCVDCVADIKINYVTTTMTSGTTSTVSTIQASGVMSGTVVYVEPEPATTTSEETTTSIATTTAEETTTSIATTTAEETTTSIATITTAETTTSIATTTTQDTTISVETTTSEQTTTSVTTTAEESTTSTEAGTASTGTTTTSIDTTTTAPLPSTTTLSGSTTATTDSTITTTDSTTASGILTSDVSSSAELSTTTAESTMTTVASESVSSAESTSEASTLITGPTTTTFDMHTTAASTSQGFTTIRRRCRP